MEKPDITYTYESVTFKGCESSGTNIFRPKTMSVSEWLSFWDVATKVDFKKIPHMDQKIKELELEVQDLVNAISDLEERLYKAENEQ
jgi:hypothetical protein